MAAGVRSGGSTCVGECRAFLAARTSTCPASMRHQARPLHDRPGEAGSPLKDWPGNVAGGLFRERTRELYARSGSNGLPSDSKSDALSH
jgi:hypothetical protein